MNPKQPQDVAKKKHTEKNVVIPGAWENSIAYVDEFGNITTDSPAIA